MADDKKDKSAQPAAGESAGSGDHQGEQMAAELRKLQSAYFYGLEDSNEPFKVAVLVSIVFHLFIFWFMFPSVRQAEAQVVEKKRVVIRKYRLPPPEMKEKLQKKEIKKTKTKKVLIPDPTPDEPEPIQELQVEVEDDDMPLDDDFYIPVPEAPPGPVMVGGDIAEPEQITPCFSNIKYTEIARAVRKEGVVILQAIIDRNGVVKDVKILRGLGYGLDEEAEAALRRCKFKPGYSRASSRPVEVIYTLTVNFKLTN